MGVALSDSGAPVGFVLPFLIYADARLGSVAPFKALTLMGGHGLGSFTDEARSEVEAVAIGGE